MTYKEMLNENLVKIMTNEKLNEDQKIKQIEIICSNIIKNVLAKEFNLKLEHEFPTKKVKGK